MLTKFSIGKAIDPCCESHKVAAYASPSPNAAPAQESTRLSVSSCRISRARPAPSATRKANSLVRAAARRLGYSAREIVSGAGHDAVSVARHIPTAMIFIPCKDGLSHNEAESILPAQAEAGCQVLLEAVVARANRAA